MPDQFSLLIASVAPWLPIATAALAALTVIMALATLMSLRRARRERLTYEVMARTMREECDLLRREMAEQARLARGEAGDGLTKFQDSLFRAFSILGQSIDGKVREFGGRLGEGMAAMNGRVDALAQKLDRDIAQMGEESARGRDSLRETIEGRLHAHGQAHEMHAKTLREEVSASLRTLGDRNAATLGEMGAHQKERLENTERALRDLMQKNSAEQAALRGTVEGRLDTLRAENAQKLDEMRKTVDEKLQTTLETRLGESFTRVVEQLNRVHEGLGEMKNLASNVGDLKSVLTNVKVRGTYGEVQLALILEQFMAPHQYVKDARVNERTLERVEYAVKFPGRGDAEVLLPIDAKFPRETFERLVEASEAGQIDLVLQLRKELEAQIRKCAKDIRDKYVLPPVTTDFAVMFLPTESLYAEVLRQPGLFETLQRDFRVTVAGPTTLSALLSAHAGRFPHAGHREAVERGLADSWRCQDRVRKIQRSRRGAGETARYGDEVRREARHAHARPDADPARRARPAGCGGGRAARHGRRGRRRCGAPPAGGAGAAVFRYRRLSPRGSGRQVASIPNARARKRRFSSRRWMIAALSSPP